jgi:hypothetical protein
MRFIEREIQSSKDEIYIAQSKHKQQRTQDSNIKGKTSIELILRSLFPLQI